MGLVISSLLFQPPRPASYTDRDKSFIWLKCPGKGAKDPETGKEVPVEIPSVYLSYKGSDLVLLHSHGNATDLGQMMPYLELLRSSLKINVFSYEYQGYGISRPKVKCTEQRIYDSIEAAVDYLITVRGHKRSNIIIFGTSLGSGPSIYIANKYSRKNRKNRQLTEARKSKSKRSSSPVSAPAGPSSARAHRKEKTKSATLPNKGGSVSFRTRRSRNESTDDEITLEQNGSRENFSQGLSIDTDRIENGVNGSDFDDDDDEDSFRGLILQSAFTSVIRIKLKQPLKFLDMFCNIDKIEGVDCPVFIVHGKVDEVVPFEHALILSKKVAYPYKPLYIDYAGHNNIMDILSVERYLKEIYKFIIFLNQEEQKRREKRKLEDDDSITVESPAPVSSPNPRRVMNASTDSDFSEVRRLSSVDNVYR